MATRWVNLCTLPSNLKSHTEALTGFSHVCRPDGLSTTFLSQGYVLGANSGSGEGKHTAHSQDRIKGKEPEVAEIQLTGQPTVTSSQWPPPIPHYFIQDHLCLLSTKALNIIRIFFPRDCFLCSWNFYKSNYVISILLFLAFVHSIWCFWD